MRLEENWSHSALIPSVWDGFDHVLISFLVIFPDSYGNDLLALFVDGDYASNSLFQEQIS